MDDLLKDKFLSFEGDIPMSDWFAIEEKLDRKRRFAWIWWAALPLLIIVGLGFYSLFIDKQEDTLTKNSITQKTKSKREVTLIENKKSDRVNSKPLIEYDNKEVKRTDLKSQKPISKTNFIPEIEITETKIVSEFIFESITLSGKPLSELWTYKYITPAVEKIKDLEPVSKKTRKPGILSFEFGLNLAPAMGLDAIKENKNNWINHHYFSSIEGSSSLGSGFNNGIHAQMNIGHRWYIRQGIYSSTYSIYYNYDYTITELTLITVGRGIDGYMDLNTSDYQHIQHNGKASIKYFSLPFMVGNRLNINKKMGLETKIGVNISRLMSAQGKTVNPTYLSLEDINSNNTIKKWNTGLTISTGLFYKPNNKFIFTAEPTFSTLLGSARNKDYPVKTRYYNYGFNLNVNYIFGRK